MKIRVVPGSCLFILLLPFFVFAGDKARPVSVVTVVVAPVQDEILLIGSVTARRVSRISPRIDGFISAMLVDEGDEVRAGDALLRLDPVMAKLGLERARAQVQEAEAALNEAGRQRDEAAELLKEKHISATIHEASLAEVNIKTAALKRLQAEFSQQRERVARHIIYAPFTGVVARKEVEVGQWVETSTVLIELVEISFLRVDVPVPQIYFEQIRQGTATTIKFDALPGRSFDGKVSIKIPVGNASARTFPIRMEIDNAEGLIAPGMSARVSIKLEQARQAMLLPRDAIIRKPDDSESIWMLVNDNDQMKARPVPVQTGRAYRGNVEVFAAGLHVGDKVIVRGNEILQVDQLVYIAREHELKL